MYHRSKHCVFDTSQKHGDIPSSTLTIKHSLHSKSTYFYRWGSYVVPGVCVLALLLGGFITISPQINSVYADENIEESHDLETYAADSAISLTIANDGSFVGNANVNEVSYITNTFTVNVNKYANYTVKLSAMNGSGTELRGRDNAFATIAGVGTKVAPANFSPNTWGYSYSEDTTANPDSLTYSSMPAYNSDEVLFQKTLTGTEINQDKSYLLAFAAKISDTSPADHYVGNFLLSVVGTAFTPEEYKLTYNANNGTGAPAEQSCLQTTVGGSCNVAVTSGEPTRSGYTFQGWSDSDAANATVQYTAGNAITLSGNKTIYAVWKANVTWSTMTRMDQMTSDICASANLNSTKQLIDDRDGITKKYYVTKLADGNCWMTQNLAYGTKDTTSIGTPCELSRTDDNPVANGATCTEGTSWTDSNTDKYFAIGKHDDASHTSQGNYYNWPAAVQNGTGGTNIQGVCPPGWQLPISNTTTADRSFGELTTAYDIDDNSAGSTALRSRPLYFQYSGYIYDGILIDSSSNGCYWSSMSLGTTGAYGLDLSSSYASPSRGSSRNSGFSVRCVAQ